MAKIRIISVGKTKEAWLDEAIAEYIKRLSNKITIEFVFPKDNSKLLSLIEKESNCIYLDPVGIPMASEEFSDFIFKKLEENGANLTFVIGGPEGLPAVLKKESNLLSLSLMTFTHQITRLILMEQIYRAFAIANNSPYHK